MMYTDIENAVQKAEQSSGITLHPDQKALVWSAVEIIFNARKNDDLEKECVQLYIDVMLRRQILIDGLDEQAQEVWWHYNRGFQDEDGDLSVLSNYCSDDYEIIEKNLDIYIKYSGVEKISKSQRLLLKRVLIKDAELDCEFNLEGEYFIALNLKEIYESMEPETRKVFRAILIEQES